jgi:hypothetical protein
MDEDSTRTGEQIPCPLVPLVQSFESQVDNTHSMSLFLCKERSTDAKRLKWLTKITRELLTSKIRRRGDQQYLLFFWMRASFEPKRRNLTAVNS